jgi:conjugative transfer pilus assembly protein TraH
VLPFNRFVLRTATLLIVAFMCLPLVGRAGDLNQEVNTMFNNLGAIGNYTNPGAFRGQMYDTYTGGSYMLRSPNKVYQLAAVAFPTAKAGCGGIDVFGGSFSHISATEFKNMLKNITAALPGIAFQLALETVSPLLGSMTKWGKDLETMINNARINSCETAKATVGSAADAVGFRSQDACAQLAMKMGLAVDIEAARTLCQTNRPSILASARTSADPAIRAEAPFVGNITWSALKTVSTLTDPERELIMSIVGYVIWYPEESGRDPDPHPPTLNTLAKLLYGQSDAGAGKVNVHLYKCNDYVNCDAPTDDPAYVHTPFTTKVETLMRRIADAIKNRTAIPNNSAEVGFVNATSEPVYKMLSIGTAVRDSGLADDLITQYRDVIAADYAYTFLHRNLFTGMTALEKSYLLDDRQRQSVKTTVDRARFMLGNFRNVVSHLELLERQLRSTMPQHVMDMLGQRAAYLSK